MHRFICFVYDGAVSIDLSHLSEPELLVRKSIVAKLIQAGLLRRHCYSLDSMAHLLAAKIVRWNQAGANSFFVKSLLRFFDLESEIRYGTFLFEFAALFIADNVVVTIFLSEVIYASFVVLRALPFSVNFLWPYHLIERLCAALAADLSILDAILHNGSKTMSVVAVRRVF